MIVHKLFESKWILEYKGADLIDDDRRYAVYISGKVACHDFFDNIQLQVKLLCCLLVSNRLLLFLLLHQLYQQRQIINQLQFFQQQIEEYVDFMDGIKRLFFFTLYDRSIQVLNVCYNNILWNLKMGGLFERLFRRHLIMYDPEEWSRRLGDKCDKCNVSLTHEKCISLCNCYYFAHEDCFKPAFAEQIHSENTDIRCKKCQYDLRLQLTSQFKYNPSLTKFKLLKLTICLVLLMLTVIGIMVTLNSELKVQYAFFILYIEGVILSIMLYLLVICIRNIFYQKIIRIHQAISTKLDIQTSAFKDIELETNEEITKDCLFATDKK